MGADCKKYIFSNEGEVVIHNEVPTTEEMVESEGKDGHVARGFLTS